MRLIGLLCWYDESPRELVACVASLHRLGCAALVACDGAYSLYPGGRPVSAPDQHAALHLACREAGMALTVHQPREPWAGNEMEKRSALFSLGWALAEPGDWFVVMDSDQVVTVFPEDLEKRLRSTDRDVAAVTFCDEVALAAQNPNWNPYHVTRILFRAQPITVAHNHYTYLAADGSPLWAGGDSLEDGVPCLDLSDEFEVLHRPALRSKERQLEKLAYYTEREGSGIERGTCGCGQRATRKMPTRWRMSDVGPVAEWTEVCPRCAKRVARANRRELSALGVVPESVKVIDRYGRPPDAPEKPNQPSSAVAAR